MRRDTRLTIAIALNVAIVALQVGFGFGAHSLGLIADAGHNVTDVAALALSLIAVRWARRAPTESKSFGYHRATILAAQANAVAIIAVAVIVAVESVHRLVNPVDVDGPIVAVIAFIAFAANTFAALVLASRDSDMNMRSALLHMWGDAAASLGVAVAGVVIALTGGFERLDPAVSLAICGLITWQAARLIRETTEVLLESTPAGLDVDELARTMAEVEGVEEVHDLHVWGLSDEVHVLSAHVVLEGHPTLEEAQAVGVEVKRAIAGPYRVAHATLELECEGCVDDGSWCSMDGDQYLKSSP
jgi:cobalt-zinc-cadmium efflux system protein